MNNEHFNEKELGDKEIEEEIKRLMELVKLSRDYRSSDEKTREAMVDNSAEEELDHGTISDLADRLIEEIKNQRV
jgi:hypothetical protein